MGMDKANRVALEVQADLYEKEALAEIEKANCYPGMEMGKPYSILQLGRGVIYRAMQELANHVEVVRCKDCKHWTMGYCNRFAYYDYEPTTNEDDFCSYGERRTDES